MAGQDNWQTEPRDDRGRWTSGGGDITPALRNGVDSAVSVLPMAVRDGLDTVLNRFDRNFRSDVVGALPGGKGMAPACWRTRSIRFPSTAKAASDRQIRT
jgi:hypothetical protein